MVITAGSSGVGVRGAELTEDLPEQVGEVVLAGDAVQQRPVLLPHRVPVDVGHVGDPIIVPHDPERLVVGLLPQRGRIRGEPGPAPVDYDLVVVVIRIGFPVGLARRSACPGR